MGSRCSQAAYSRLLDLRQPNVVAGWGLLDVVVVALGFLNLMPGANNYSAVRAFRVLRPLRAVSRVPKLKVRNRVNNTAHPRGRSCT